MHEFLKAPHAQRFQAVYASDPSRTRGRFYPEQLSPTRSEFQRDRDRIIHSTAFRRLKHKTQVFVMHEGDHYRTRLTHTLEVSQIARALARSLGLDEDLAEALALSHDLGHPPFGHAGEDVLNACMKDNGGFDHNAQALRIVTKLEQRYAAYDGLNLTWETLEGLVKHNGPLLDKSAQPFGRYKKTGVPRAIVEYTEKHPLDLASFASGEAQCAAIADDIAYNSHDIDDGLRAGLFTLDDLKAVPFLEELLTEIDTLYPHLEPQRRIHELTRRVITRFVEDVVATSQANVAALNPRSVADIRGHTRTLVCFSAPMNITEQRIKAFLMHHMYRHPLVFKPRQDAEGIVEDLYNHLIKNPQDLPPEWQKTLSLERSVADYIAGMTDNYAVKAHQRFFNTTPDL